MSARLTEDQIDDLLSYLEVTAPTYWKEHEKLVCCPIHGESHPSMGISSELQVTHCFACGFSGGFHKLLAYAKPDEFGLKQDDPKSEFRALRNAKQFLKDRYALEYHELGYKGKSIKRYEETLNKKLMPLENHRVAIPKYKIAPFMSGKETYKYFFDRGFTKQEMRDFSIGRDIDNKTVTIPVFYEDGKLAGVIGRYISKKRLKNQRYKIYDGFERSKLLYPLDHFRVKDDTIIIVEGQFDAIRLHSLGYTNTLASMTVSLSKNQADWISNHCSTVIYIGDNDGRGIEGRDKSRKLLGNRVKFKIVEYPLYGKDICDWSEEDIHNMINNAGSILSRGIRRI